MTASWPHEWQRPAGPAPGGVVICLVAPRPLGVLADPSLRSGQALKVGTTFESGHYRSLQFVG